MNGVDLEQKQREEARWRTQRVLDAGRPIAVSENIVWRILNDVSLALSIGALRPELDYLRTLGLIEIDGQQSGTWYARLTARGVDVIEYTIDAPPGVGRLRKYW
jgi:hypothetical protein